MKKETLGLIIVILAIMSIIFAAQSHMAINRMKAAENECNIHLQEQIDKIAGEIKSVISKAKF